MKNPIHFVVALCCFSCLNAQEKSDEATPKTKANVDQSLYTKKYTVPVTFFSWLEKGNEPPSTDPFAATAKRSGKKKVTPDEKLATLGIITGENGVSTVYNLATKTLILRGTLKHHEVLAATLEEFTENSEKQLLVIVEFIEVEHLDFSDWLLDNRLSGDATKLRKTVQEWLHDKRGTILETAVITARSGQRAKTESGDEYIYPSEVAPPSMPSTLTLGTKAELPESGPYPSGFETRNLGVTLEVDPVIGSDNLTIDLNLAPEIIMLNGHSELFSEETPDTLKVSMPIFHRMKVTTQITLLDGRYVLAGSCRPMPDEKSKRDDAMVLLFVRADIGHMGEWSVEEVAAE